MVFREFIEILIVVAFSNNSNLLCQCVRFKHAVMALAIRSFHSFKGYPNNIQT